MPGDAGSDPAGEALGLVKGSPRWPGNWLIDRRKLTQYLLDLNHPRGGSKAKFFVKHGFAPDDPQALADALLRHPTASGAALTIVEDEGDTVMLFEGAILTPSRTAPLIRSVWQIDPLGDAQFVTAYPIRKVKIP